MYSLENPEVIWSLMKEMNVTEKYRNRKVNKTWNVIGKAVMKSQKALVLASFPDNKVSQLNVLDSRVQHVFGSRKPDVVGHHYFNVYDVDRNTRKYSIIDMLLTDFSGLESLELRHLDVKILRNLNEKIQSKELPRVTRLAFHQLVQDDVGDEITKSDFDAATSLIEQVKILAVGTFVSGKWIEILFGSIFNHGLHTVILMSMESQDKWLSIDKYELTSVLSSETTLEHCFLGNRPFKVDTQKLLAIRMRRLKEFETLSDSSVTEENIKQLSSVWLLWDKLCSLTLNYGSTDPLYHLFLSGKKWHSLTLVFDRREMDAEQVSALLGNQPDLTKLQISGKDVDELKRLVTEEGLKELVRLTPGLKMACIFPLGRQFGDFMLEDYICLKRLVGIFTFWTYIEVLHLPSPLDKSLDMKGKKTINYREYFVEQLHHFLDNLRTIVFIDDAYVVEEQVLKKQNNYEDVILRNSEDYYEGIKVIIVNSHPHHFCRCPFSPVVYGRELPLSRDF